MPSTNNSKSTGQVTEQLAADYLAKQGLSLQSANFHNRAGEIDLVMTETDTWVFVEVKYRRNNNFGGAISAVQFKNSKKLNNVQHIICNKQD